MLMSIRGVLRACVEAGFVEDFVQSPSSSNELLRKAHAPLLRKTPRFDFHDLSHVHSMYRYIPPYQPTHNTYQINKHLASLTP
jgi:hypothetical protein